VVVAGGIAENPPDVRRRICEGLFEFDHDRNATVIDTEGLISRENCRVHACVIPTEEGLMIAHEATAELYV